MQAFQVMTRDPFNYHSIFSGDTFITLDIESDAETGYLEAQNALHPTNFVPQYENLRNRLQRLQSEAQKIKALISDLGRPNHDSHSLRQKMYTNTIGIVSIIFYLVTS